MGKGLLEVELDGGLRKENERLKSELEDTRDVVRKLEFQLTELIKATRKDVLACLDRCDNEVRRLKELV